MIVQTIPAILAPILKPLGDCLVDPIKNQVSYLCCYSSNVEKLTDEVPELNTRKESVQQDVDAAEANLGVIRREVRSWLSDVEKVQKDSNRIRDEAAEVQKRSCLFRWCPPLHYSLSKKAKKTTEYSIELQETRFERISNPVNPADLPPIPSRFASGFGSRDPIENEMIDALKDDGVYLIGIYGMGGVGKTTMAKKIGERLREKTEGSGSMFEQVVMAVVSQQPDLSKIQKEIAEGLGLELKQETLGIRAHLLHERLKAAKSVLIILDDVWERLNLEEIGIPSQSTHAGCKLILTSRHQNALTLTEDAKIFQLEVLTDEESWILFRRNAGNLIDSPILHPIAKNVVEECKGLPLALVTVGRTLRDAQRKSSWEDALLELQQSMPTNIPDVLEKVYRPLSLSLNRLGSDEARYLFLLCCLFPEDYEISLEELVRYGVGLGIFKGIENLRQARNRVESIVENLISRSLLIETRLGNLRVKMHDVVRDVGIWIASEGKHEFMISHGKNEWPMPKEDSYDNYTCISLTFPHPENIVAPGCINCPRLELLHMNCAVVWEPCSLTMPKNFFSGMRGLKVLEASGIKSLPSSIYLLNNLRSLHLRRCTMQMTSVIGELKNLEILCLELCLGFEVLPQEIGRLKKLRKLDVTHCWTLRRIPFGVISGLVRLEELVVLRGFSNWTAEEKDNEINGNASLAELDLLCYLTTLRIEILDPNVIPKTKPPWAQKVKEYSIVASKSRRYLLSKFQKIIELGNEVVTPLGDWIYDMVRDAEFLDLKGPSCMIVTNAQYLSNAFSESQENGAIFPKLKSLDIGDSCSLQEISNGPPPAGSFVELEEIILTKLSGLKRLWTFPSERLYLSNLRKVLINECASLLYLFPLSMAGSLLQLEQLEISDCPVMKEIFKKDEGGMEIPINKIEFPKLRSLSLESLKSLCGFCKGVDGIEVPALRELKLINLPSIMGEGDRDIHQQFLFDQQVAGNSFNFSGLQSLEVKGIDNIKTLFSHSILSDFPNLKELTVGNCSMLEEVIGKEENAGEIETKRTLFPRLQEICLPRLLKIRTFCHDMCDVFELPYLQRLWIEGCPMMETFVQGPSYVNQSFFSKEVAGYTFNFCALQKLKVRGIHNFRSLFSPSILSGFPNLKKLTVKNCSKLEEVIGKEENVGDVIEFPSLEKLRIVDCPLMQTFVQGLSNASQSFFSKQVSCPKLKSLRLRGLNMAGIFSHDTRIENYCGLEILEIESCHRMTNSFSPSIFRDLKNIRFLELVDCGELQEVIAKEDQAGPTNIKETFSPHLCRLDLRKLPKVQRFCHMNNDLEFPSLERVEIRDCPMLRRFSLRPVPSPLFKRTRGLLEHKYCHYLFMGTTESFDEIHSDGNCFTISARDLSINCGPVLDLFLTRDYSSGGSLVTAIWQPERTVASLDITGKFETEKLTAGVTYEIFFVIALHGGAGVWKKPVDLKLTLPGGDTQDRTEILDEKPRREWIKILVGEFTIEPHQIGQLQFSLHHMFSNSEKKGSLHTKGARIRMKA